VEVQRTSPVSALNYLSAVRSRVDDHVDFDTATVSPSTAIAKIFTSLQRQYKAPKRRRAALVQQHILDWTLKLDLSNHQHRLFLTIAVVSLMTASRFSDFAPHNIKDFSPRLDATQADVCWEQERGFIRFTDHKTAARGEWPPKPLPRPVASFPLVTERGAVIRNWDELIRCTRVDLPHHLLLSVYLHVRRLLALQPSSSTPTHLRPLFERSDGKPVAYRWYYSALKAAAAACGHKHLSPHSGRKGGVIASQATGLASTHDTRMLANMRSEATFSIYNEATVTRTEGIVRAMESSSHTAVMCDRAFGGSDFVTPSSFPAPPHGF